VRHWHVEPGKRHRHQRKCLRGGNRACLTKENIVPSAPQPKSCPLANLWFATQMPATDVIASSPRRVLSIPLFCHDPQQEKHITSNTKSSDVRTNVAEFRPKLAPKPQLGRANQTPTSTRQEIQTSENLVLVTVHPAFSLLPQDSKKPYGVSPMSDTC
jgi:hypothetical protein